jgi:predicted MPP superfamily phosphohydrolase
VRLSIFIIIFLSVFALLNLYIVKRFINKLHINKKYKLYFKLFLVLNYIGVIGYMYARYNPDLPNWLFLLLSLPLGIVFLIFSTAVVYDITDTFIKKVPMSDSRRDFFKKGLDYASVAVALGISGRAIYEAKFIELEKVDIKIKNLKQSYSIVQISDVHIGGLIDQKFIRDIVKRVNILNADIVVITGDLVDIALDYAKPALNELKNLKSKYGTYFIVGNHEYLHGIDEIIEVVNSLGIKTLENENVYIGEKDKGFNLAGVYDQVGYRMEHHLPDLKKALENIETKAPTVLLAHQPVFIEEVSSDVALVLSGHTHGGQLYPFRILVKMVQPYIAGLYQHNVDTQIYVNKGTGFWGPPMRLGASSEITYIRIGSIPHSVSVSSKGSD